MREGMTSCTDKDGVFEADFAALTTMKSLMHLTAALSHAIITKLAMTFRPNE